MPAATRLLRGRSLTDSAPCPRCGHSVPVRDIRCLNCGEFVLYGLVAAPVLHASLLARAARVLAAWPGGPEPREARRRLKDGLPLIVGLSRFDTEAMQGQLVDTGLMPRIGPAPEGTVPLSTVPALAHLERRWVLGLVLAAAGAALWAVFSGKSPPKPSAAAVTTSSETPPPPPTRETVPPESRLDLSCRLQREDDGGLYLTGTAQVATLDTPLPSGDLALSLRAGPEGPNLFTDSVSDATAVVESQITGNQVLGRKTLSFRVPVSDDALKGASALTVEGNWAERRSGRLPVNLPPPR